MIFPTELNDAVDKTTDRKNLIPNELSLLDLTTKEAEGLVNKANLERVAILNDSIAQINKMAANRDQQIAIDTDKILKT